MTGAYDAEIHGPNGFVRQATGNLFSPETGVEAAPTIVGGADHPKVRLTLRNGSATTQTLRVNGLHNHPHIFTLTRHASEVVELDPLTRNHGWYELNVSVERHPLYMRRFAGHLENGEPSRTGPE